MYVLILNPNWNLFLQERGSLVVLLTKSTNLQVYLFFLDSEGRPVILEVMHINKESFRVVAVYAH